MEKLLAFAFLMVTFPSSDMVSALPGRVDNSPSSLRHLSLPVPPRVATSSATYLSDVNAEFALRLYKEIAAQLRSASENILFSPLSISSDLSMLTLGAEGNTLVQILKVLGYNITNNDAVRVGEIYRQILERVNYLTDGINMGSSLLVQKGQEIHEQFLKEAEELYNADTETVDFREQQSTKDKINACVKNKTEGQIPDFLTKPLSSDTLMILLNYLVLKGEWLRSFDPIHTYEADFHVDRNTTVKVQMMRRTGIYLWTYAEYLSSDVLVMDYSGNTSLLILLPKSADLAEVEQKLTRQRLRQLSRSLHTHPVDVHLPKITLKTSYNFKSILQSIGIEDAFTNSADFSRISKQRLQLSEVIQNAVLEVDEKGTDSSAATGIEVKSTSIPLEFKCNKPFLLLIVESNTENILMAGRLVKPSI